MNYDKIILFALILRIVVGLLLLTVTTYENIYHDKQPTPMRSLVILICLI